MKSTFRTIVGVIAIVAALSACKKEYVPDGTVELQSIKLTSSLNSSLPSDIVGTIDASAKTITFVIPESVTTTSFIPTFTVTTDDVMKASSTLVESGVTSISITDGAKIIIADEKSNMMITYTVVVVGNDERAELLNVKIAAADNAGLIAEDITAEVAAEMLTRVPAAAFRQELTLQLTATSNDVIKVNGSAITDGKAVNVDTAFPIDITVSDEIAGKTASYVLKVGKILENKCELAGTYANADLRDYVALAVDQKADIPYIVVNENNTVDGTTTKNYATVLKYDGSLSVLGQNKFSPSSATYCMIDVMDGKPYVAFVDAGAPTKSRISCMAYDGAWNLVGAQGFGAKITGISNYKFSMILDPVTKYPIVALTTNEALNGLAKRDLALCSYDGSAWNANYAMNGRTQTYCYNEKLARGEDKVVCLAANQNDKTFSLYQYKDKSWTVLQSDLKLEGTTDICTMFADAEVAPDGTIYIAIGDNSSGNYLCKLFKYDGTQLVKAANPLPGVTFDISKCQWDLTFDAAGNPVVAAISADASSNLSAQLFTIDQETKDWASPIALPTPSGSYIAAGRSDNGTVYVAYPTVDADSKYTVNLYKYALEADILPE